VKEYEMTMKILILWLICNDININDSNIINVYYGNININVKESIINNINVCVKASNNVAIIMLILMCVN